MPGETPVPVRYQYDVGTRTITTGGTETPVSVPVGSLPDLWHDAARVTLDRLRDLARLSERAAGAPPTYWNSEADPYVIEAHAQMRTVGGCACGTCRTPVPEDYVALGRVLPPDTFAHFLRDRWFDLPTRHDTYRLTDSAPGNVYRHRDRARFCLAHPSRLAPISALLACQVFLLQHDAREFERRANLLGLVTDLPFAPGHGGYVEYTEQPLARRGPLGDTGP